MLKIKTINSVVWQYLTAALLSLVIFGLISHAWNLTIGIPFYYSWDAIFSSVFIKSVMDTGWYAINPYLGAPGGYNLADFPMADHFHFLMIKILSGFINHYAVLMNIFYILTFPMIAVTSLFVFRRLGLNYLFALAASLLFALQPYHFFRGSVGHLFLASYFVVPLVIWLAVMIATNQIARLSQKYGYIQWGIYGLICLLIGSTGVYYAIFGLFFILASGIITSISNHKIKPVLLSILLSGLVVSALIVNIFSTITYHKQYGVNVEVADRTPFEAELYGFKITQMLLPITNDRLPYLRNIKEQYNKTAPGVNTENESVTLGAVASIGFLILLGIAIVGLNVNREMAIASKLNLFAVLVATIGGFSSLFAYTVSPMVRCYSRISIFIAFLALYAFFYVLQKIVEKYAIFEKKIFLLGLVICIVIFGVISQTGKSFANLQDKQVIANFNNDENFVREIEKNMSPGSEIFQLPYVPFPEYPPIFSMVDYEQFRPYLHSHNLKWSYGSLKGRPIAAWQNKQSHLPVQQMINNLSYMGYSAIYIDRNGYADHGVEIEKQINEVLHVKPWISGDNNFSLFDMRTYIDNLKKSESVSWSSHIEQTYLQSKISIGWSKGFYPLETANNFTWHWSNKKGVLEIVNYDNKPIRLKLSFKLWTQDSSTSDLILKSKLVNRLFKVDNKGVLFSDIIEVPPGMHPLFLMSNAPRVEAPGDRRKLYFQVQDFNYELI